VGGGVHLLKSRKYVDVIFINFLNWPEVVCNIDSGTAYVPMKDNIHLKPQRFPVEWCDFWSKHCNI
jgi:hypothetical protein